MLGALSTWVSEGELKDDKKVREWLAALVRKSIPWDDLREPPRAVWQSLLRGGDSDRDAYAFVYVEGQVAKVATQKFFVNFPRTEETRALVEALARFDYLGGGRSWSFEGGELHKRVVARWLRAHEKEVVASLQPRAGVAPVEAVGVAVSLLGLAALARERKRLPEGLPDFVAALLKPLPPGQDKVVRFNPKTGDWRAAVRDDPKLADPGRVVAITKRWQDLADNLYSRHHELLRFVRDELEVPQGRAGGEVNFIDPQPILSAHDTLRKEVAVGQLGDEYFSDYWEGRFTRIGKTKPYSDLPAALAEERAEISRLAGEIRGTLQQWGYADPADALRSFLGDAAEVFKARQATGLVVPDQEFEALQKSQALTKRVDMWAEAIAGATAVAEGQDPMEVLLFDPRHLLDLHAAIRVLAGYLNRLEQEVAGEEADLAVGGDPKAAEAQLLSTLDRLAGTAEGGGDDQAPELEESA
jgi:hypothetical protein